MLLYSVDHTQSLRQNLQNLKDPKTPLRQAFPDFDVPSNDLLDWGTERLSSNRPWTLQEQEAALLLFARTSLLPAKQDLACALHLSFEEIVALTSYTTDDFKLMNRSLRNGSASVAQLLFRDVINGALDKFPVYTGWVKRGLHLSPEDLQKYIKGGEITFTAFTSTTANMNLTGFEMKNRFIIYSRTGRDISQFSGSAGESEVLFKSGTRFRVLDVRNNVSIGEGASARTAETQITLEELTSETEFQAPFGYPEFLFK